jgi:putative ABC transport system permease protein
VRRIFWALSALTGHWRRHPVNFLALLVGLAIATALWSGVAALNDEARRSYARAAAVFTNGGANSVVSSRGGLFSQDIYVKLRLMGFKVSPVLEGAITIGQKPYRLIGIEPLTLPHETQLSHIAGKTVSDDFLQRPGRALASPQMLQELGLAEGAAPVTDAGRKLPPLEVGAEAPPGLLIVDIGYAQDLLGRPALLSRLIVSGASSLDTAALAALSDGALRPVGPEETPELEKLTAAFHLNLAAFGLLSFLVGLFIVHASFGLAFEQRLPMIRAMRATGLSLRALVAAMLAELALFGLVSGVIGVACGYLLAVALLPNVSASLDSLYGAQVPVRMDFEAYRLLSGVGMAMIGALIAAASGLLKTLRLPILQVAQPYAWRLQQQWMIRDQSVLAGVGFAAALSALFFGEDLLAGFVAIAGVLLGTALLLPLLLAGALRLAEEGAKAPASQWFWADCRQQLSGLSLALMALLVALSTNVGVGTMVEGFRLTFLEWLDQRLVAEVYLEAASAEDGRAVEAWLKMRPEVAAILPVWRAQTTLGGWPTDIVGARPHETYRAHFPMLAAARDAWERVAQGEAILVSEQLARRLRLGIGSLVDIPTASKDWRVEIAGVYPDYGNPKGQLRVDLNALMRHWPNAQRTNYSLRVAPEAAPALIRDLQERFGLELARVVDQARVKELSIAIFERTFAVTAALNSLTLLVSGVALLATLMTLSNLRLAQIAPVWAIGVARRRLAALELFRIAFFAFATAIVSLPLGLAMAWLLVSVVNVQAFGWRVPFHIFPALWAEVVLLALLTASASAIAPILQLGRVSPAALLKVFASER